MGAKGDDGANPETSDQHAHDAAGWPISNDSEENFVGTWTNRLRFGDQFLPDGQGAVLLLAVGPLEYAEGHTAIVQVHEHEVFGKGDIRKREFIKATCGGQ